MKVRINLHGIMNISSASLIESKESPDNDVPEEQQKINENSEQPQNETANGQPEVGSSGWTKKISAWFSRVRYWTWRWPGISLSQPFLWFFSSVVVFSWILLIVVVICLLLCMFVSSRFILFLLTLFPLAFCVEISGINLF